MGRKLLFTILSLGLAAVLYLFLFHQTGLSTQNHSTITTVPSTSLEKSICKKVSARIGDCQRFLLFDADSKLVFAESSTGIVPVLTNKEFTEFKKFIIPMMDFQEFREEEVERGPIDWRVATNITDNFSIIYGFAEDNAKTIVVNSEGNIQPNKFFVRNNLWVWYVTLQKGEIKLPVTITVYNEAGHIIYDGHNE